MIVTIDTTMCPNFAGLFLQWLGEQYYTITVETNDGEVYEGTPDYYDSPKALGQDMNEGWLRLLLMKENGRLVRIPGTEILKIDV